MSGMCQELQAPEELVTEGWGWGDTRPQIT